MISDALLACTKRQMLVVLTRQLPSMSATALNVKSFVIKFWIGHICQFIYNQVRHLLLITETFFYFGRVNITAKYEMITPKICKQTKNNNF